MNRRTVQVFVASIAAVAAACGGATPARQTDAASPDLIVPSTFIYQDAMASPWADWSWATHTLSNTSPVAAGTHSIKVDMGPWQALYFHRSAFAASTYSALVLSVNGGTSGGGVALQVRAVLSDGSATLGVALGSSCAGGAIQAGKWVDCQIPLASIAPANASITGIAVQEWSGKTLPSLYFDEIGLQTIQQPVAISISPASASVAAGQTQQLSAAVTGNTNTAVTWSVQEGAAGGTVSSSGLYTAPAAAGTFHVVATSQADTTKSATATVAVTVPSGCGTSCAPAKESWVWVYTDYANTLTSITNNKASFTHVSPTFYTVNYHYQSGVAYYSTCPNISYCTGNSANDFSGLTTRQFAAGVAAIGLQTVPAIYGGAGNSGTDDGIKNILDNTNGAGDAFITAMTNEAVNNGYAGYNLDWETGSAVNGTYADKFIAFVNKFKSALAPHGMSLSVDAIVSNIDGTWCSGNSGYLDFPKLAASSIDRIMIEDYVSTLGKATLSCQNVVLSTSSPVACDFTFTGELDLMCSPNLPLDKAVIGMDADPNATNPIAGAAFSTLESYGFTRVAVWPQYPFMNASGIQPAGASWYSLLQGFLTH